MLGSLESLVCSSVCCSISCLELKGETFFLRGISFIDRSRKVGVEIRDSSHRVASLPFAVSLPHNFSLLIYKGRPAFSQSRLQHAEGQFRPCKDCFNRIRNQRGSPSPSGFLGTDRLVLPLRGAVLHVTPSSFQSAQILSSFGKIPEIVTRR